MSDEDEDFEELILTNRIKKKDPLADRQLGLVVSRYPQEKGEPRRSLFRLLANPDREVVRIARELILVLRKNKNPS